MKTWMKLCPSACNGLSSNVSNGKPFAKAGGRFDTHWGSAGTGSIAYGRQGAEPKRRLSAYDARSVLVVAYRKKQGTIGSMTECFLLGETIAHS